MASGDGFRRPFVPRSAEWHFRQRQQRRAQSMGHAGYPLRVEQIAHSEHLFHCWKRLNSEGGKGAGIDGHTYADFSPGEVGQILGDLSRQAVGGNYFSERVRKVRIPKKPGSDAFRTLKIGTLCDRVLGSAVDHAFRGFWKARFLRWSYGFREGMSTWRLLAELEVAMQITGRRVLAIDDVKNAFDTVPIDRVVELHTQELKNLHQANFSHEEKRRTVALVEAVLRGHDRKRERGIDQGAPYSPTALNVLLHGHHDLKIKKEISKKLPWFRYADNLCYLARSVSEGRQALRKAIHLLEPLGMTLKGEDGVRDLSHGDEAHLLGFSLCWDGNALHLKTAPETFDQLKQRLDAVHATPSPPRAALEVARGWVEAYAPAFEDGDVSHVLDVMTERGFRENISLLLLKEWWQGAWERWQECRKARARHRTR
jgi:retron-type reverse transcriptase